MKQFLIRIILFVLFLFLVDKLFYWKVQSLPNKDYDKRLELILEGKMNKDILIFGSSRAQHDVYSDAIQDSLKMSTYNLGYRGSSIDFQLFLLKTVLKHNKKPKMIFLTIDEGSEFVLEKTLNFRYDKLYPLVKYQEITDELIDKKEISSFARVMYCARISKNQFSGPNKKTKYENWTSAGTVLLDLKEKNFDRIKSESKEYETKFELKNLLEDFATFQEICNSENIKLFILMPPNSAIQNKKFVKRVESLILSKNTKFYFEKSPDFSNTEYFSDELHLNKKGAILYTNQIINKLEKYHKTKTKN